MAPAVHTGCCCTSGTPCGAAAGAASRLTAGCTHTHQIMKPEVFSTHGLLRCPLCAFQAGEGDERAAENLHAVAVALIQVMSGLQVCTTMLCSEMSDCARPCADLGTPHCTLYGMALSVNLYSILHPVASTHCGCEALKLWLRAFHILLPLVGPSHAFPNRSSIRLLWPDVLVLLPELVSVLLKLLKS